MNSELGEEGSGAMNTCLAPGRTVGGGVLDGVSWRERQCLLESGMHETEVMKGVH